MSKFANYAKKSESDYRKHESEQKVNFMNGISYTVSPLLNLEMIAASSIFGEINYYETEEEITQKFIEACDKALDYDFEGVLRLAVKLRNEFNMRLNPALIMVRAVMHGKRIEFNKQYKDFMSKCILEILNIPTDIWNQFELWMFFNKSKNRLPSLLKRVWATKLSKTTKYQLAKYKTKARIIDLIRICHANSEDINELMKTGTIEVSDEESTWEKLRSEGKNWKEILKTTYVPHMALVRNLRGIFSEIDDEEVANQILKSLEDGVEAGKQFPFRYWTALQNIITEDSINFKTKITESLNNCLDKAMNNFPRLKGKTICLSDNSGSAWGAFTTEYGSVKIAEIDNLSATMTAMNSDEGEVGVFGDTLITIPINKRDGVLSQLTNVSHQGEKVGRATENGIWLFFKKALKEKLYYDNIFIYSDQQAGHGGLYGVDSSEYEEYRYNGDRYIDVLKLVQEYRRTVNPRVNVFSIQTAGYDNSVLPENEHRTSILSGWTGKETVYAKELIDIWNKEEGISQKNIKKDLTKIKTHANIINKYTN